MVDAFSNSFSVTPAWGFACANRDCLYSNLLQHDAERKLMIPVDGAINSLEDGIAAALSKDFVEGWECRDTDACQGCKDKVPHPEHCRGMGGWNGPVIVDHGRLMLVNLKRFKVCLTCIASVEFAEA